MLKPYASETLRAAVIAIMTGGFPWEWIPPGDRRYVSLMMWDTDDGPIRTMIALDWVGPLGMVRGSHLLEANPGDKPDRAVNDAEHAAWDLGLTLRWRNTAGGAWSVADVRDPHYFESEPDMGGD